MGASSGLGLASAEALAAEGANVTLVGRRRDLLEREARDPVVTMQVFQRNASVLGGIDEAIAILKQCSGRRLDDGTWEGSDYAVDLI